MALRTLSIGRGAAALAALIVMVIMALPQAALAQDADSSESNGLDSLLESENFAEKFEELRRQRIESIAQIEQLQSTRIQIEQLIRDNTTRMGVLEDQLRVRPIADQDTLNADIENAQERIAVLREERRRAFDLDPSSEVVRRLDDQILGLEFEIDDLRFAINNYDRLVAEREERIETLETLRRKTEEFQLDLQSIPNQISAEERKLSSINIDIDGLLTSVDTVNSFKLKISMTFAGLVLLVIVGFFIVAVLDEEVRESIFSNESGIQFITLFSLVIAIILFGIIDILEGKELAALLGGLSGYILGRGSGERRQKAEEQAQQPQGANPPAGAGAGAGGGGAASPVTP